jgi:uncharacterized protein (TIGR02646 family)
MFNVTRPTEVPACLSRNQYNETEVVFTLESIFFGKCYLCERDALSDPEIEHFDPHEGDPTKKFDWNNLYYCCSRCNSIKGSIHKNLLDCCDANVDVFRSIKCLLPSVPDNPIIVETGFSSPTSTVLNTVALLQKCYNEDNTALRGITRAVLVDRLFDMFSDFLGYRVKLRDKKYGKGEKDLAKERLLAMLDVRFPFSCFWRWHVLGDSFLSQYLSQDINF